MEKCYPLIIGGKEKFSDKRETVIDKFSGETIAEACIADSGDVESALQAADNARSALADMPAFRRSEIVGKAAALLSERKERIWKTIAREAGKPAKFARVEVERCVENVQYAAEEAKRIHGETVPMNASKAGLGRTGYYERFPVGVVVAISPFNFPLNLAAHKLAPAIASGCPVILKPASMTPLSGIELVKAFVDAGVPEGGISVLVGPGSTVGESLITDRRVDKISFTGSRAVGEHIVQNAGLKKVTMELGSNSGIVVDKTIPDFDFCVKRSVFGAFYYQGQVCISVQRIYIHADLYDRFVDACIREAGKLRIGNPLDDNTDVGPMISETESERVESWVNEAVSQGARVIHGGRREGSIYHPTVLTGASQDMRIVRDEVFGPVVTLHKVDSFESGVALLNDTEYGLQAGVFTSDINRALDAVRKLNVGGVMVNDFPTYRVDHMP
ncbi:aldehyde dehydrogenase family protein, partial [candidate division KSB1 bacterium]